MNFNNKIKGFSVAEAMVTLLIVSIALSAIAPIFSKRSSATLNNQSKWEKTADGHITRVSGNVGVGVTVAAQPDSKFHVIDADATNYRFGSSDAYFSIKGASGDTIFEISKTSGITFRLPAGDTIALFKNSDGNEVAKINSDGSASFGVPAGAVMFFNLNDCPDGWTELTGVNDAFIKIGTPSNPSNMPTATDANIATKDLNIGCTCSAQGGCTCNVVSDGSGSGSNVTVKEVDVAQTNANLLQPKHITLKACQKNAYPTAGGGA